MKYSPLPVAALLMALAGGNAALAERTPPRAAPLQPSSGEVIVGFKAGATVTRMHALAVKLDAAQIGHLLAQRAATLGARVGRALEAGAAVSERVQVVRARGIDAATLAAQLAADPDVEFAVPNGRKRLAAAPNDPLYPATPRVNLAQKTGGPDAGQWYLRAPNATEVAGIDIESAWLQTTGSADMVVAVLDTGVRKDHPDLVGRFLQGYDFISDAVIANDSDGRDNDPSDPGDWVNQTDINSGSLAAFGCTAADISDSSWHGTGTASLIGAATDNRVGMAGAAPGVSVLPLRVLGKCGGSDVDIQAAMLWAVGIHVPGVVPDNRNPAKVLNMSLGGIGPCNAAYQNVVNQVTAQGAVIVVSAGNDGLAVTTPANCQGVIAVAGVRHVGTKVGYSDLGPEIAIAAPAGNCVNDAPGPCLYPILVASNAGTQGPGASIYTDSFNLSFGTSFSAPLVAGTAALMYSAQPALTPGGVIAALKGSARPFPSSGVADGPSGPIVACRAPTATAQDQCYCTASTCGAGMLDAGAALSVALGARVAIGVAPAAPLANQTVTLGAGNSTAASGRSITGYQWVLVDGGGIVSAIAGANTATATLLPAAAGSFTVRLVATDNLGVRLAAQQTVTVTAALQPPVASGGSGGGALSWPWLLALLLAALVLAKPLSRGR